MIQLTHCKSEAHAKGYFENHLASGDYYSEHDTVTGVWVGDGAMRLRLPNEPTREVFQCLCDNRDPFTGKSITPRTNGSGQRRIFSDVTFSPPKSVSILALVLRDQRVVEAYRQSVQEAIRELEKLACVRVRKDGAKDESRYTGNIVACLFEHDSSRALDPQLHSHLTTFNFTYDEIDSRWMALDPGEIARRSGLLTEIFRNALAKRLRRLGYEIRASGKSFEVVGLPPTIIKLFSKRNREIDEQEAAFGTKNNPQVRALVAHQLRAAKRQDITHAELEKLWRDQISATDWLALQQLVASANQPRRSLERDPVAVVAAAAHHLLERQSVVAVHKLLQQALIFGRAKVEVEELRQVIAAHPDLLVKSEYFTSRQVEQMERDLLATVERGLATQPALHPQPVITEKLSREQLAATLFLLGNRDRFVSLTGPAGAGKSNLLAAFLAQVEATGRTVSLAASNSGAVEELRQKGFPQPITLHQVMEDPAIARRLSGGVLILDEAGQASLHQMLALFRLAEENDFRVVLVGDPRQHHSVEAGDALRILEEHSPIAKTELRTIQRQKKEGYLAAIRSLQKLEIAQGFFQLDQMEAIHELRRDHRYVAAARAIVASMAARESCLGVVSTHREALDVTAEIRIEARECGLLRGEDVLLEVLDPLQRTDAEKNHLPLYEPGQVLVFHRGRSPARAGEAVRVVGAQEGCLLIEKRDGAVVPIRVSEHADNFGVFVPREIAVAPGDQLWLRANLRSNKTGRLNNGEIVTVQRLQRDGSIALTDGRTIPATFRQFTHGYAQTSFAAQGKTVHRVVIVIDAASAQEAASFESFYVAASRATHDIHLFTDDKAALLEAFLESSKRTSALEFLGGTAPQKSSVNSTPIHHPHANPLRQTPLQPESAAQARAGRSRPGHPSGLADLPRPQLSAPVSIRRSVRRPHHAQCAGTDPGQRPALGPAYPQPVRPPQRGAGR